MSDSHNRMVKAYDPKDIEDGWYQKWEDNGFFHAEADSKKETYTIVIPPPNVTGVLTLGHVLNNTLQDILIRWQKMNGKETCWVPGTDHAGIATQSKVEAHLRQTQGITRFDLGREEFLQHVWDWKKQYGGAIIRQLRKLGVACDWERERFTLDDGLSEAVIETFIRLYNKGLIYKGTRIIHWCPKSQTALSDEEVIYQKITGKIWFIRYPFSGSDDFLVVATTRPETMLGDTGVAVHPDDQRYKQFIGRKISLPLMDRDIPIFADTYVEQEFGTGAVKVTPAHDPNDYAMALRHGLPFINVMHEDGTMNEHAGELFQGLDRYACREKVIAMLDEQGLLEKIEEHEHQVGYSERGQVPVEPRLSEQWFVKTKPLAEKALQVVREKQIRFHPEKWVKTYYHWLENIKDWCISRQLWWGHRIPAYYCKKCSHIVVAKQSPTSCPSCNHPHFRQDEDVLDTWFSSWLWPLSVFGWPENSDDLKQFYPTNTLVTGPDIIFFWVARMIMAGLEFVDEIPFQDVYFTSIIRDDGGRKLSKSLNNSPDPIDVIQEYGADALRFTMIYIAPVGQDIRYSKEKCQIGRHFANKLWNAARFRNIQEKITAEEKTIPQALRSDDQWILCRAQTFIHHSTERLHKFDFHGYAIGLYEFVWNEFCDLYVESIKTVLYSQQKEQEKKCSLFVFDTVFSIILRIMHPVMPFITEELYHTLEYSEESIMLSSWPKDTGISFHASSQIEDLVEEKFTFIRAGRNLRNTYNIPFSTKVRYIIKPNNRDFEKLLRQDSDSMTTLLHAESITIDATFHAESSLPSSVGHYGTIFMPLTGIIDREKEYQQLAKQVEELQRGICAVEKKLGNEQFLSRAPEHVVSREYQRKNEMVEKLEQVQSLINGLPSI